MAGLEVKKMKVQSSHDSLKKCPMDSVGCYEDSLSVERVRRASIQDLPDELLGIIFSILDRRSCVAASVVCRRWSGVALDELWRSISSLVPLFKLLGPADPDGYFYDLRPDVVISDETWNRFKSYALRVRSLTYAGPESDMGISITLILRALVAFPEGGILPKLRIAHWDVGEEGENEILPFCSPLLERMHLNIDSMYFGVKFVQRLLSSLASSRLKGLKCFKYVADLDRRQDAQLEQSLKTFILSQRGLEELELLSYQIQNTDFIMDLCEAFPLLHNFCGNLSYFTREQFRATLTVLANGWPALRRIGIARTGFEDRSLREETMEPGDIAALARLPGVEDARFWFDCHFKLDINDIRHMGEAWSRLKSLVLSAWQPNPPLSHLIPFANSFPVIEQLIAPFDCNSPLPLAIDVSARFSTLKTLWILDAVIEANTDGSLIAEFLSMVCGPNVKIQMTEDVMDLPQMFEERRDWVDDSFENREKLDDILRRIEAFHRVQEGIRRMA